MLLLLALAPSYTNYQMVTPVVLRIYHMHLVTLNLAAEFPKKGIYALIYSLDKFKPYLDRPQFT
jgi:hypothetical protein